jgi:hypothetical protein
MCGLTKKPSRYTHLILILEENTSYAAIVGSPSATYISSVIRSCGLASDYRNITHDSLPNYLALTDGASLSALAPYDDDCSPGPSCDVTSGNVFEQVGARWKRGWRAYDESMPARCYAGSVDDYAARHNPAVYYTDLTAGRCRADDVPLGTLRSSPLLRALRSESTAPAFSFVTPNLCDDMHGAPGCPSDVMAAGDQWLRRWLPRIAASSVYRDGQTAVFVVWDEGGGGYPGEACVGNASDPSCHVPAIVIAPSVRRGTVVSAPFSHYSLLKTIEQLLGLPELGQARRANSLVNAFNL